jgi:hypothetical protein
MMVVGAPRLQRMIAPPIGHCRGFNGQDRVLAKDRWSLATEQVLYCEF